ncbi:MAG: hypothetical protein H6739_06850 [Alphaproteobacteria bacterium]|nr:hypothetical protein [Alphaproteobacteria bacterium]
MHTVWVLMAETGFIEAPYTAVQSIRASEHKGRPAVVSLPLGVDTFFKRWQDTRPSTATEHDRVALNLHLDGPRALDIAVGVYHCLTCQRWFRAQPPFLRRNAIYTNRVVRTAVASVISDGMAFSKVPCRRALNS